VVALGSGVFCLTGCQTKKMEPRALVEGGTAYVRVKEYWAQPRKEWVPAGGEAKLAFGEAVTLIKKAEKDGPNNMFWLTSRKTGDQVWIPAYLLTSSEVEIASLKDERRIPETMRFFYEKPGVGPIRVAGAAHIVPFITLSDGMPASDQGADTRLIQDYLGHRDIRHTVIYTATNPARFERLWR